MSQTTIPSRRLLTIPEVAELLQVSTKTVRRRIDSGALVAFRDERVVRIDSEEVHRYIARGCTS